MTKLANKDRPRPMSFLGVAQLEACRTWNAEAAGSSPAAQTNHRTTR